MFIVSYTCFIKLSHSRYCCIGICYNETLVFIQCVSHIQGVNMAKTLYIYFVLYLGNKVFSCILSHATQSVLFCTTCCLLYKIYFIQIIFTFFINHVLTFKYWPCRIKVSKHIEFSLFCSLCLLRMVNRILLFSKLWDCSAMKRQRVMGGHSARVSSL